MRDKVITVSTLNIVTHPHSPENYINLLQAAHDADIRVNYSGNKYAKVGQIQGNDDDGQKGVAGHIYFFSEFDLNKPWLNTKKNDEADQSDLSNVSLPDTLKPEFKKMPFVFTTAGRKFYYPSKDDKGNSFAPKTVERVLHSILNAAELVDRFGEVEVTSIPSAEALDKIFAIPHLSRLTIVLTRPNPDDWEEMEEDARKMLDDQKAKREERTLVSINRSTSLEPSEKTKALAGVAASNGYVTAVGRNEQERRVEESTKNHPMRIPVALRGRPIIGALTELIRSIT